MENIHALHVKVAQKIILFCLYTWLHYTVDMKIFILFPLFLSKTLLCSDGKVFP